MKTASSLLQALALGAVFLVQPLHQGEAQLTGVRRALQTIATTVDLAPAAVEIGFADQDS